MGFLAARNTLSSAAEATAARTRRTSGKVLTHGAERASAGKWGDGCEWGFLDEDAAENSYQIATSEGMPAEQVCHARWATTISETNFVRPRDALQSEGKGHMFATIHGFLLGRKDASYQQVADTLSAAPRNAKSDHASPLSGAVARRSGLDPLHAPSGRRGRYCAILGSNDGLGLQSWQPP